MQKIIFKTLTGVWTSACQNFIILDDFDVGTSNEMTSDFGENYNLKNKIEEPICIDFVLTNQPNCFIEPELSNVHIATFTVLKA